MPYVKIEYGSSHNISVQGTDWIEVDEIPEDEPGRQKLLDEVWQEAVNDFMADTYADFSEGGPDE